MKRWARTFAAIVTIVAGLAIVLVAIVERFPVEADDPPTGANATFAVGVGVLVLGLALFFTWWAAIPAACALAAAALVDWSGSATDGSEVDGVIAAIALVLLGSVALLGHRRAA